MQPQGKSLQIQIEEIEFNKLVRWLDELTTRQGLAIESIDVSQTGKPGEVRVRRLQVAKI